MKFRVYFALLMSGVLSLLMSAWITFINIGFQAHFLSSWMTAWSLAWPAAGDCFCIRPKCPKNQPEIGSALLKKPISRGYS